ncbi:MAG: glycoside hydrolase family 9 protein, partial [Oscillospiraceae bacterium]|nr:glycoside hydrolase family 9 protein [Oscillospiraceae bacterium]
MHFKKNMSKRALAGVAALAITASAVMTGSFFSKPDVAEAAGSDNYAKLLQYSLFLYDANMCGSDVKDKSLLTWRSNCHTSDLGGFHDAGDHAIFGLPEGYSASTLGWGYYEFKDTYDKIGVTAHLKTITDHFAQFIKNCTKLNGSSVSSLCYQVGDAGTDHSYWGPPEEQGSRGETHWTSNGSGDIAAEYAAALALNYINFGNAEDLTYAKALYNYAKQNSGTTFVPGIYESSNSDDDLAWASGWMYLATKDNQYKNNLYSGYLGYTHCWNNVSVGAACVKAHITGDWSEVNSYIGNVVNGSGNYFFQDQWGSARYNTTAQFTALVASKNSSADYTTWCKGQMDYILGSNPANTCFVVGFASNSAKQPHHRAASGVKTDGTPQYGNPGNSLIGALVGGPSDQGGSYTDSVTDFKCNEVAIDYNAGFVGAAAGLYDKYKTGTVDATIVGAKSNGISGSVPSTTTTTTAPKITQPTSTTTKQQSSTGTGVYKYDYDQDIVYSELPADDKMIGFKYSDFGIKASEHVTKVEVNISSSKTIGKWQGAFGSSTSVSPDYWTQTADQSKTFTGTSGTLTWEPDAATSKIIQTQYGGEFKFGVWWIDCGEFTIDSIVITTDAAGKIPETTTTKASTTTTKTPTTTTKAPVSTAGVYEYKYDQDIVYSELPADDKMIGFKYSDFGIK